MDNNDMDNNEIIVGKVIYVVLTNETIMEGFYLKWIGNILRHVNQLIASIPYFDKYKVIDWDNRHMTNYAGDDLTQYEKKKNYVILYHMASWKL